MRNLTLIVIVFSLFCMRLQAQQKRTAYTDSLKAYQKQYIDSHEVIKGDDKKYLRFYPINAQYRVKARFEFIPKGEWFNMPTSAGRAQTYRKYGKLTFKIHDTTVVLYVYQSQSFMAVEKYRDYLFVPFTDLTNGVSSYDNGRYLEYYVKDIEQNVLIVDFNKAYNPYCAYEKGYSCPIPPSENALPVTIAAGEMKFGKGH